MMFPGGLLSNGLQKSDRQAAEHVGLQQDGAKANARGGHASDFHRLKHDPWFLSEASCLNVRCDGSRSTSRTRAIC
jgi:hypothetical protein